MKRTKHIAAGLAAALLAAGAAGQEEGGRMVPDSAAVIRRALDAFEIHYGESRQGDATVFDYALAVDADRPVLPCDILARDGAPHAVARAAIPRRVPAARRRDVASCLLDLNRRRAAGTYRFDWGERRVFCEFAVPREYLPEAPTAEETLLFVGAPTLYLDESRDAILSAAGLGPSSASGEEEAPGESAGTPAPFAARGDDASGGDEEIVPEEAPWAADTAAAALRSRGVQADITLRTPERWTFQFPVRLPTRSLFATATAVLNVTGNWVFLSISPELRIAERDRGAVAEWAMRVTGEGEPAAFAWLDDCDDALRIAVKTSCPAGVFAGDPDGWLERLLLDGAAPLVAHSRSLAAVLSGAATPARALAASVEGGWR